jgi:hypothetical protein
MSYFALFPPAQTQQPMVVNVEEAPTANGLPPNPQTYANSDTTLYLKPGDKLGNIEATGLLIDSTNPNYPGSVEIVDYPTTDVDKPGSGQLIIRGDAPDGGNNSIALQTADGVARWGIGITGFEPVPPVPNQGCDWALYRYDNDGGFLGNPINVSRNTGIVTCESGLIAPNVVQSNTTSVAYVTEPIPSPIPSSSLAGVFGNTFTVPKTGYYLVNAGVSVDADSTTGATIGPSYSVIIVVYDVTGAYTVAGSVTLKPWSVPAGTGNDYILTATAVMVLTTGRTYRASFAGNNISGTLAIPSGDAFATVLALC